MGSQTRFLLTSFFSLVRMVLVSSRIKKSEMRKRKRATRTVMERFRQTASQLMMRGIQTIDLHV
jgi:hypothetical protein